MRFAGDGRYRDRFITTPGVARLATNGSDDLAVLDKDDKTVLLFDRDGKQFGRVPIRGAGYELDAPVDIAFDAFGHLYVLDQSKASIYVFGPQFTEQTPLLTSFTVTDKRAAAGAFRKALAFALDPAGRLYIFDDSTQQVQIYR